MSVQLPRIPGSYQCAKGEIEDPWFGLRDLTEDALADVIQSENDYLKDQAVELQELAESILTETKTRICTHPQIDYPTRSGNLHTFTRTGVEDQHPTLYLTPEPFDPKRILKDDLEGCSIILDMNQLAAECGEAGFDIGGSDITKDGKHLLYTLCTDGSEIYQLIERTLENGEERTLASGIDGSLSLTGKYAIIIYLNEMMRAYKVSAINIENGRETTIFTEPDDTYWVGVGVSLCESWLLVGSSSHDATRALAYKILDQGFKLWHVSPVDETTHYQIAAYKSTILLGVDRINGESLVTDIDGNILVPARKNQQIISVDPVRYTGDETTRLLVGWQGAGRCWLEDWTDGQATLVDGPAGQDVTLDHVDDIDALLLIDCNDWVHESTLWSVDPKTGESIQLPNWPAEGYNPDNYTFNRLMVEAHDGTEIPVTLVRHESTPLGSPALVYAYGAYGCSLDAWFSPSRVSLLDRGAIFAVVHARGGGELGRNWHELGRKERKVNTFTDVNDTVKRLKELGVIGHAVLRGGSAGGATVAACANLDQGLYTGLVAEVPFVDALATMSDDTLPLTVGEYNEWGNPQTDAGYAAIKAWSPVDNVQEGRYPDYYITCGVNDPRVGYWEALKLAARIREAHKENIALVKVTEGAGHQGASGRFDSLLEEAEILAFTLNRLGLN